jgi:hypothetical protein
MSGLWDFTTGQEYTQIEEVEGDEVVRCIASFPISVGNEEECVAVCNEHNMTVLLLRERDDFIVQADMWDQFLVWLKAKDAKEQAHAIGQ